MKVNPLLPAATVRSFLTKDTRRCFTFPLFQRRLKNSRLSRIETFKIKRGSWINNSKILRVPTSFSCYSTKFSNIIVSSVQQITRKRVCVEDPTDINLTEIRSTLVRKKIDREERSSREISKGVRFGLGFVVVVAIDV